MQPQIIPLEDVIAVIKNPRRNAVPLNINCFVVAGSMYPEVAAIAKADNFDYGFLLIPIDPVTGKGMPQHYGVLLADPTTGTEMPRYFEPTLH